MSTTEKARRRALRDLRVAQGALGLVEQWLTATEKGLKDKEPQSEADPATTGHEGVLMVDGRCRDKGLGG